jgi:hypothetical protein
VLVGLREGGGGEFSMGGGACHLGTRFGGECTRGTTFRRERVNRGKTCCVAQRYGTAVVQDIVSHCGMLAVLPTLLHGAGLFSCSALPPDGAQPDGICAAQPRQA